ADTRRRRRVVGRGPRAHQRVAHPADVRPSDRRDRVCPARGDGGLDLRRRKSESAFQAAPLLRFSLSRPDAVRLGVDASPTIAGTAAPIVYRWGLTFAERK